MAVYLVHFDRPISPKHSCQHYLGYASDVEKRVAHHRNGTSKARLFEVALERGIGFKVVKIWEDGDRGLERSLKDQKKAWRHCPVCRAERGKDGDHHPAAA